MAELAALEELLLSGFDVNALLAGAPGLSGLEAQLVEAQHLQGGLGQQLGWPGPGNQDMYVAQDYQQTLAAEHRLRQVQVATALQQLQNLQQQQSDLAALQQQLQGLTGGRASAFGRSRTSDLESYGRRPGYDVSSALAPPALDYLQLSALQAMPDAQRGVQGVLMQHNLPVRSFSSEHLVAGRTGRQQPNINTAAPGIAASGTTSGPPGGKRPPFRQPSGLGPNGRGQGRPADGRRHRATAKAPSWASDDWNPMKAVLASGAHASGGTGVFLPHLGSRQPPTDAGSAAAATSGATPSSSGHLGLPPGATHSPTTSERSPTCCSADHNVPEQLSRQTTVDFSRGSTFSDFEALHSAPCGVSLGGYLQAGDAMKVVAEEPEREREDSAEERDFASMAKKLAELMTRQVLG